MEQVNELPPERPSISNNGFLLSVAVFPVVFAWLLTLLIKAFVPFSTIDADTEFATITAPQHKSHITRNYLVSGVIKQDFSDRHLFVVEENEGTVYPKTSVSYQHSSWSANLYTGAPVGDDFRIVLMAVSKDDKERFNNWFKTGEATGKYPGLPILDSMQELSAVTVQVSDE